MLEDFDIAGFYYNKMVNGKLYEFRKYLDIKRISQSRCTPDLMVVMMNPGSSNPLEDIYDKETKANPDKTQYQIINVMNNCNFNYARVLNLSDLREPKSPIFYKNIPILDQHTNHSIFSENRSKDFNALFIKDIPLIIAWGVNYKLKKLAEQAFEKLGNRFVRVEKVNKDYAAYHPLPRSIIKQKEWVADITFQLK